MPERFIDTHIRNVPMFRNLSQNQLALIAQQFEARRYEAGEWVFLQNQPSQGLYILTSGQGVLVQVGQDGVQRQVAVMQPGQFVNEESLIQQSTENLSLGITQTATVLFLARNRFMTLVAHHQDLKESLGFGAQIKQPKKFKSQRENEEVLLITRGHWWAYFRAIWLPLLVMFGLWILAFTVQEPVLTIALFAISIVVPGGILLYLYIEWRNDSIIVTDERIIRITHTIMTFSESFNEIAVSSIQEANAEYPGFDPFARIFNYGTVQLRTAGSAGNFELHFIPNPEKLQDLILEDRRLFDERQAQKHRQRMRAELERWIGDEQSGQNQTSESSESGTAPKQKNFSFSPLRTRILLDDGGIKYRKHWQVWLRAMSMPFIFFIFAIALFVGAPLVEGAGIILGTIGLVLFIVGGVWFLWSDWDWRHDYYIVNDTMIILVHQRPLLLQDENDQILLKQVDNVVAETNGIMRQLLRYGNVRISLVGGDTHKIFEDVPRPLEIQGEISRRQARMKQSQDERSAREQRELIGEYLSVYHQASAQGQLPETPAQPQSVSGQLTNFQAQTQPVAPQQQQPPPPPPISQGNVEDRSRPPGIPRKRLTPTTTPMISRGKPYQPPMERVRKPPENRPPSIPPRRDS